MQFAVTVVEARRLAGTNNNPMIAVTVGNEVQKTPIKFSTDNPLYETYMTFDITKPQLKFINETVRLTVSWTLGEALSSHTIVGQKSTKECSNNF